MKYRDAPAAADAADPADPPDPAETEADEAPAEVRHAVVDAQAHGERLDKVLVALAPEFSRTWLQTLIARGHVRVDGAAAGTASRRLRAGQAVEVTLQPTDESLAFRPQAMPLAVLYEDDAIAIVDKPAGLVVHPAPGHWSGTLLNALLARHAGAERLPRAGIVHRLDKDTSGAMVVGKTLEAVTALTRAIAERQVRRIYVALAHGRVEPERFSVEAPIGRDPAVRVRMAVVPGGRPARTDVACVAAQGDGADALSAIACRLHTGRTHQIRVHLAHHGHPLVADALYGGRPALGLQRQALHALRLELPHPGGGREVAVEAPLPPDIADAWQAVARQAPASLLPAGWSTGPAAARRDRG